MSFSRCVAFTRDWSRGIFLTYLDITSHGDGRSGRSIQQLAAQTKHGFGLSEVQAAVGVTAQGLASPSAGSPRGSAALGPRSKAGGASLSVATLQRFAAVPGCDWQLAIVGREGTLKHGVPATFRRRS